MLLEAINDEKNEALSGDELMKTLHEIAQKGTEQQKQSPLIGKSVKDQLNAKEQRSNRSMMFSEREALHARANSLKRAMHNVAEHSKLIDSQQKRFSVVESSYVVTSTSSESSSPWASATPIVPPINIVSPSVSTTHLTCLSPLPDLRRDSMDDYFFNSLNLPVPMQFADGSSRRSSGVPYSIKETNELMDEIFPLCSKESRRKSSDATIAKANANYINVVDQQKHNESSKCRLDYIASEQRDEQDEFDLMPVEVYERKLLRNQTSAAGVAGSNSTTTTRPETNNMLQVPCIDLPILEIERPPSTENVYVSESITLIDTDPPVSVKFYGIRELFQFCSWPLEKLNFF